MGTEHILLALWKLGQGTAFDVLWNRNVSYDAVLAELKRLVSFGSEIQVNRDPILTRRVKMVFEYAKHAFYEDFGTEKMFCRNCDDEQMTGQKRTFCPSHKYNYVGTKHLLFALVEESYGIATQILKNLNINLVDVKSLVQPIYVMF